MVDRQLRNHPATRQLSTVTESPRGFRHGIPMLGRAWSRVTESDRVLGQVGGELADRPVGERQPQRAGTGLGRRSDEVLVVGGHATSLAPDQTRSTFTVTALAVV